MLNPMLFDLIAMVLKVAVALLIALQVAPIMVWVERRQAAMIQRRVGPNRVGLFGFRMFGLGQPLADTIKLIFKEDFVPKQANKVFYVMAPMITGLAGLVAIVGLPLGSYVEVFGTRVNLQPVELNAGFLYLFAVSALGVYGAALAGWSSNNKYALLGGLRASAQMVSYEIAMGMSLLPIVIIFGTLNMQDIIAAQSGHLLFGFLPAWGVFYAPVSMCIFVVCMFAETNRLPFDLAEGEAELVAGFLTEYGSMRWSLFFLGEYAMMTTLSGLAVCLFFGGYEIPWLPQTRILELLTGAGLGRELALWVMFPLGLGVLLGKIAVFMFLFVQARFTLPRFRYDQLMDLGWKIMFPFALANLVVSAVWAAIAKFGLP